MDNEMREKIKDLSDLKRDQIGETEESVKINFVVPLLECFGHSRLDFEYKYKDIYIKKRLPRTSRVVVETKNYGKVLDKELSQLEKYCYEERPLLGIIANGEEFLVFSYFWRFRRSFMHQLVYRIRRKDLDKDDTITALEGILSRENLKNDYAKKTLMYRENEIEKAEAEIATIEKDFYEKEKDVKDKIDVFKSQIEKLENNIEECRADIKNIATEKKEKISLILKDMGLIPLKLVSKKKSSGAKIVKPGEKGYIVKYRAMLGNPDSLPFKIKRYVEEKNGVAWKELKRACVELFGCKSETSGSIGASVKVLEIDGFVKVEGKGEHKRILPAD